MKHLAFLAALALVACNGDHDHDHDDHDEGGHAHAHEPKHGGELVELGDHEGFLEIALSHDDGTCRIWLYQGEEMKDVAPGAPPVLNLKAADGVKSLTAKDGGDGSWVFTDESLKDEPENARFRIVMGGKTYTPELAHHH